MRRIFSILWLLVAVGFASSPAYASGRRVLLQPLGGDSPLPAKELAFLADVVRAGLAESGADRLEVALSGEVDFVIAGRVVPFAGGLAAVLEAHRSGQDVLVTSVTTPRCADSAALVPALRSAALELGARLVAVEAVPPPAISAAAPEPTPAVAGKPPRPVPVPSGPSRLKVRSEPSGALVSVSREPQGQGRSLGPTPVDATLEPGRYYLDIQLAEHHSAARDIDLMPGRTHELDYQLGPKSPPAPLAIAGHALLWPGIATMAVGGLLSIDADSLIPTWICLGAGAGLAATGIVLLAVAPSSEAARQPRRSAVLTPLPGGAAVSYSAQFSSLR